MRLTKNFIDRKVDEHVERQLSAYLPDPAPLPLAVEAIATVAQWTGIVLGSFVKGLQR